MESIHQMKKKLTPRAIFLFFIILIGCILIGLQFGKFDLKKVDYSASRSADGYAITIIVHKRYLIPITVEGPFPSVTTRYSLLLVGDGVSWSYRGQDGFYYDASQVRIKNRSYDMGYAWMDSERKHVNLNFYWVASPNGLEPADINGRYDL